VNEPLLLGLDIGTSSSKAVLVDPEGRLVASAERGHGLSMPRPGWFEHDAEKVWWADLGALWAELAPRAGGRLAGICVSGIGPCLLPADEQGRPLRPAILYGIDTRAEREIEELTERYGAERILERCGSPLTSQAIGPKLAWLRRHEPEVWSRTSRMLMAHTFVVLRLTGAYVLDHHSASQCDPLYDLRAGRWIGEWADEIAPGLELPSLAWSGEVVGRVTPAAAGATGLPAGTPVTTGTIDAWAEALSAGVRRPGDLMLMYGTTMFMVEVSGEPRPDRRLWLTRGVFPGSYTRAAGMATSGALTAWFRELVGSPPFESLLAEAAAVPPGAGGLVVLPYFAGERTPIFDPAARGLVCGLTLSHGRGHLYRALLEATAYGVRHNLEVMEGGGGEVSRLKAVGGGTRGGLWAQVVSDVIGLPQEVPAITLGASYGDALLAAIGTGLVPQGTDWNRVAEVVEPRPEAHDAYARLYPLYRDLYPATREAMHALAALQETTLGLATLGA
jgi:xylulokinase